ncbi:MAG: 50S ribosomal protein L30 [archaeon]
MYAVIRIRGNTGIRRELARTLDVIGVDRANHLVLVKESNSNAKMIAKAKDYITWGEIDENTLALLLEKRALLAGNKKIGVEFLKKKGFKGFAELAEAVMSGKTGLRELGIKKFFRLHPPRKGFERNGIKKAFPEGGALGYRKSAINKLIEKMA